MNVIGVVDLLNGRAVHARAGNREHYVPVTEVAGSLVNSGDALTVARTYLERLGLSELYVADLDALSGRQCQNALVSRLVGLGAPLWLDAGISSVERAQQAFNLGATRIVVALETLSSFDELALICETAGADHVAFSLDLRDGRPVIAGPPAETTDAIAHGEPPHVLARRAADAGVGALIVIDLARVGTNAGPDLALIRSVRKAAPTVQLLAGGGIRQADDVRQLAECGCDGVLVATALHDGRLTAAEVMAVQRLSGVPPAG